MQSLPEEYLSALFGRLPIGEKVQKLYFRGDLGLLSRRKVAIVGSRKANKYAKLQTSLLSSKLSSNGFVVVSGGAEGIDTCAHEGAGQNTIAVMPCGLDIIYPKTNTSLIQRIYQNSLAISEYEDKEMPRNYSFVHRNRLVVGISEAVVIAEADTNSGSMRSAEYALKYGVPLFVLSHRIDESFGTNELLSSGLAKPIASLDSFLSYLGVEAGLNRVFDDEAIAFASTMPTIGEFLAKYRDRVYELEFEGKIEIKNGVVRAI